MNKDRLLNVVLALRESLDPDAFSMRNYQHECGSPGCALGHYASRDDLQEEFCLMAGVLSMKMVPAIYWPICYDAMHVVHHFDITQEQAVELFGGQGCGNALTPEAAALYIEEFVRRHSEAVPS